MISSFPSVEVQAINWKGPQEVSAGLQTDALHQGSGPLTAGN